MTTNKIVCIYSIWCREEVTVLTLILLPASWLGLPNLIPFAKEKQVYQRTHTDTPSKRREVGWVFPLYNRYTYLARLVFA